ncbi:MAG: hypothetical protein HY885_09095 [Deltaproteobacteria bacterium]|nr:hypothetical protein [Deltaproteobacteria bacterium]
MQNGPTQKHPRLPLFIRMGMAVFLLFSLIGGTAFFFLAATQRNLLLGQALKSGTMLVHYFSASAKVPLLADDTLRLHGVVKDAAALDGAAYALVVDGSGTVQAHSQEEMPGEAYVPITNGKPVGAGQDSVIVQYEDGSGRQVLDFSSPVLYNTKPIGEVHLGMSLAFIDSSIHSVQTAVGRALVVFCLLVFVLLVVLVYFYAARRDDKTAALLRGIMEYGKGNLGHRMDVKDNSELGDVALALNTMAGNLSAQQSVSPPRLENYLKFSSLDRILEGPVSTGESYAVRRQVAILFAGVKGFGSYAGTEKPEDVVMSLNKYISIVTRIISKHGGYVDKIIGDAVVGIFGVSLYREEHTARAVRAAVELQETLASGTEGQSLLLSNVCIGISSGIVLSGNIGSHSKVEYSSIGESIKEAFWLIGLGQAGEIILGEGIYTQMKDVVDVEPLPPQTVAGSEQPINTYRFVNLKNRNDT